MRLSLLFFLLCMALSFGAQANPKKNNPDKGFLTNPTIACPGDTVLSVNPFGCDVNYVYTVTANDDQAGWTLAQTQGLPSGSNFPLGVTLNVFVVTDNEGNTASCSFTVTVVDDVAPTMVCPDFTAVYVAPYDDPNDCYDGYVGSFYALSFDDGSYDNCGGNILITVQRLQPYSDCIAALNQVNGHPDCFDAIPDSPSEFERATSEAEEIKFYCCEAGSIQTVVVRGYQLDNNGNIAYNAAGQPIFNSCNALVYVETSIICEEPDTSAQLAGLVQLDANSDCLPDQESLGLSNMVVEAKSPQGETFYTVTGTGGAYGLNELPEGSLEVKVIPYLPLWSVCNNQTAVDVQQGANATELDFNALPALNCPLLTVDLATGAVTPCTTSRWPVAYSNKGSVAAQNAKVTVKVPAPYTLVDASKPFSIIDDVMTIQLGAVKPGETATFDVQIKAPCDAQLIGKNLCVEASIAPSSSCLPVSDKWLGAQLEASAVCEGDSVRFTLHNTGAAPTSKSLDFVIIDDMVVMHEGQVPAGLLPGASLKFSAKAQGQSLRIQAQQEPGHPLSQAPSLLVENCNGTNTESTALKFKNEDGNPYTDMECLPVVATNSGSQLNAFPIGIGTEHFVEANTRLTYQVDFQNSSNDDLRVVVIRDLIPAGLNPADIRLGASSHPYTWSLSGKGVLEIRFEPISLPSGSSGFVQFDVAQRPDNPVGTLIENKAEVFFDILPGFYTNIAYHTVGQNFLGSSAAQDLDGEKNSQFELYPNPASTNAFLNIKSGETVQVRILNMLGQQVVSYEGKAPGLTLERGKQPAGIYQVEVQVDGVWRQAAKLMWK